MKSIRDFLQLFVIFSDRHSNEQFFIRSLFFTSMFSLFINLLMLAPPLYMLQVYDRVMSSRSPETLLFITLLLVWLFATLGALEFVRARILTRTAFEIDYGLAPRIFTALHTNTFQQPDQINNHALQDLATIRQFLSGSAPFAFFDIPWTPVYLILLFLFDPLFGWFAVGAASILITLALLNEWSTAKQQKAAAQTQHHATEMVSASLRNCEVIQALGMQGNLRDIWQVKYEQALQENLQVADRSGMFVSLSKTLRMLFQSLILGLGAYLAINNHITAGMMIAGSIIMGRALAPIDQSIGAWKQFIAARNGFYRLLEYLKSQPETIKRMSLPPPEGNIQVENVALIPPGAKDYALKGISFSLRAGQSLAIIGPSAAGKSSLVRALLGIWPMTHGKVRLDNTEIHHWNRVELGLNIGYLPQDVELFNGTIAENIVRFGELDHNKIIQATQLAGADSMIRNLPEGYETQIGQGGTVLSGGQRQRIGLARAIYGEPKLVILDEPNANLDEQGELALNRACQLLKQQDCTLIVVSHRKSILSIVDKILVLDEGLIKVYGPQKEVIEHLMKSVSPISPAASANNQQTN